MKELTFNRKRPEEIPPVPVPNVRSQGSRAVPTMRTYGKDVKELMQDDHITKTQVIMAEEERREERGEARTVHNDDSHLTKIIFVLVLVLALGIGVGAYVLIGTKPTTPGDTGERAPIKRTERMLEIPITNSPREQILADTALAYSKTTFTPNESRVIAFTWSAENTQKRDATSGEVLRALATTKIPEVFLRSILPEIILTVEGKTISDPLIGYLTLATKSYANSVASMLLWEETMAPDLIPLLDSKFQRSQLIELRNRKWSDKRISEIDARILEDADSRVVIAYAFINKTHIVIAGNDIVLKSAIDRIQSGKDQ